MSSGGLNGRGWSSYGEGDVVWYEPRQEWETSVLEEVQTRKYHDWRLGGRGASHSDGDRHITEKSHGARVDPYQTTGQGRQNWRASEPESVPGQPRLWGGHVEVDMSQAEQRRLREKVEEIQRRVCEAGHQKQDEAEGRKRREARAAEGKTRGTFALPPEKKTRRGQASSGYEPPSSSDPLDVASWWAARERVAPLVGRTEHEPTAWRCEEARIVSLLSVREIPVVQLDVAGGSPGDAGLVSAFSVVSHCGKADGEDADDDLDKRSEVSRSQPKKKRRKAAARGHGQRKGRQGHVSEELKKTAWALYLSEKLVQMIPQDDGTLDVWYEKFYRFLLADSKQAREDLKEEQRTPVDPPFVGSKLTSVDVERALCTHMSSLAPFVWDNSLAVSLMSKMGWTDGQGLGMREQGVKVPVAVEVERQGRRPGDVSGLGSSRSWPRRCEESLPEAPVWPPEPCGAWRRACEVPSAKSWGKRLRGEIYWGGLSSWGTASESEESQRVQRRLRTFHWLRQFLEDRSCADFFRWYPGSHLPEKMKLHHRGRECVEWYRLLRAWPWGGCPRWQDGRRIAADAHRGFHGTTWYNFSKIVKDGRLHPGKARPRGVYLHKHGTSDKAAGYAVFQGIGHGIFVCVLFEALLRQSPQRIRRDQ